MDFNSDRVQSIIKCSEELNKRKEDITKLKDIRLREWQKLNTYASKLLNILIEAENILGTFDDYQLSNGQCYPEFETWYNQLAILRAEFTNFVDKNPEILELDNQINN